MLKSKQDNIKEQKADFRRSARKIRAEIKGDEKRSLDEKICAHVTSHIDFSKCSALLVYYPVGSEINILPIAEAAWEAGVRVAFPVCMESSEMIFRYCSCVDELVEGKYSIPAPSEECEQCIPDERAVCIVPALAVSKGGYRMGYGGGYYDRFLSAHKLKTICAIYDSLVFESVPRDEYDVKIETIITEKVIRKQ